VRYRRQRYQEATWVSRSMMISGTVLLLFLLVHIAQVRGWLMLADSDSLYQNLRAGFTNLPVLVIYLLGQVALAAHLYHGLWSQFQSLGIHHPRYNHLRQPFAMVVGIGIALLNIGLVLLNMDAVQGLLERLS
jgi:succinate dehydrogenase / fumarate reductase cytochrome b subunit